TAETPPTGTRGTAVNMRDFVTAGADGFGLGSALYSTGMSPLDVRTTAEAFVAAYRGCQPTSSRPKESGS
ncbi:MAG: hypothetical protein ACKOHG_03595, partial [Planctomycetia bacterium]